MVKFNHFNFNVLTWKRAWSFYEKALDLSR